MWASHSPDCRVSGHGACYVPRILCKDVEVSGLRLALGDTARDVPEMD